MFYIINMFPGLVSRVSRLSMSVTDPADRCTTSSSAHTEAPHQHIAVLVSDKEMRCVSLPSQSVLHKERFPEGGGAVVRATAIILKGQFNQS